MAHLRSIERRCQTCGGRASVQLYGWRNQEYGYYCKRDGQKAERELEAREQRKWDREKAEPTTDALPEPEEGT